MRTIDKKQLFMGLTGVSYLYTIDFRVNFASTIMVVTLGASETTDILHAESN